MSPSTKLEDKLEGIQNFLAWKYRIGLILKENGLDKYIKDEVVKPKEDEAKEKHGQDLIKEMRIIVDSIKDHLITQVSYKKKPKKMYDALSKMYEGRMLLKILTFYGHKLFPYHETLKAGKRESRQLKALPLRSDKRLE